MVSFSFRSFIHYFNRFLIYRLDRSFLLRAHLVYKYYLKLVKGLRFAPTPPRNVLWENTVLKTKEDVVKAFAIIKSSNLNLNQRDIEKNWDSLISLNIILKNTDNKAKILDAGGLRNSLILSWLYQFGYKNLKCLNLLFKKREKRGYIEIIPGDLTRTLFPNNYFDIVSCLSVLEHGVNETNYFKEMNRILKKGGLLITSTDYWENKIDTSLKTAYDNPIFIYDRESVGELLKKALNSNFILYGPTIDLDCSEKVVHWRKIDLNYTFLIFCLRKR